MRPYTIVTLCSALACATWAGAQDRPPLALNLRPHPQVVQPSEGGFPVTAATRIIIPAGWPAYVRVSAQELAEAIAGAAGPRLTVAEQERQADRRRRHRDVAAGARIRSRETAGPRASTTTLSSSLM